MLGLSFKPNTDDLREAPALHIIAGLKKRGVKVVAFDPVSMSKAEGLPQMRGVELGADAYDAARGTHAVAIITEWNEFRGMDLKRLKRVMKKPVLCDLRNLYKRDEVEGAGFAYVAVGKGVPKAIVRKAAPKRAAKRTTTRTRTASKKKS